MPCGVEGEDAHGDEAHVRDRRVGDQLLHVLLRERDERGVDDGDHRQREHQRRELLARQREHRQREAQEAVAAHLQQDRRQDHRAAGRRLDVGVGQPGVHRPHRQLHRERGEEREPQPPLHVLRELEGHQRRDVGGAGLPVHRHDREQHQHRAEQRVEEELEARVDAPLAAPHPDDQEHRDQAGFEEQVEQHEVERAEHADHQRFEHEEGDHVFLDAAARSLSQEARMHKRHQERGQDHEQHRDAVDAHLVVDRRRASPRPRRTGTPPRTCRSSTRSAATGRR